MSLHDIQSTIHLPHIIDVDIMIFTCCSKVERLHGIPWNWVCSQLCDKFGYRHSGSQVVEDESAVSTCRGKYWCFCLVKGHLVDCVGAPWYRSGGLSSIFVPDFYCWGGCCENGVVPVMVDWIEPRSTGIHLHRLSLANFTNECKRDYLLQFRVPQLDHFVRRTRKQPPVDCIAQPIHNPIMCPRRKYFFSRNQIPNFDNAISASTCNRR